MKAFVAAAAFIFAATQAGTATALCDEDVSAPVGLGLHHAAAARDTTRLFLGSSSPPHSTASRR